MRVHPRWLGPAAVLLALGCGDDSGAQMSDTGTGATETMSETGSALTFDGIESVRWDGADGLEAAWSAASGDIVGYTLSVESVATGEVEQIQTLELSATIAGLADGEYRVSVEARDSLAGAVSGDCVLEQLVAANRVVRRSEVPRVAVSDASGEGDILVVAGWHSGVDVMVVDASDIYNPTVLAEITDGGNAVKDLKLAGGILYVADECESCAGDTGAQGVEWNAFEKLGVRIYELSDPANPVRIGEIGLVHEDPTLSVHNLGYGDGHLYAIDSLADELHVYNVADPAAPVFVASWAPSNGEVHDADYVDGNVYVAYGTGFAVLDVSDPTDPRPRVFNTYGAPSASVHNAWPSRNPDFVLVTEEHEGGHLQIWNVADPMDTWVTGKYSLSNVHSIHNVLARGDYAFISYYWEGLRVLDIHDPSHPREVGWYDAFDEDSPEAADMVHPGVGSFVDGTWGVWPFGERSVAISDTRRGLILFDHFPDLVTCPGA